MDPLVPYPSPSRSYHHPSCASMQSPGCPCPCTSPRPLGQILAMHPRDDLEGLVPAFDVRRWAMMFCLSLYLGPSSIGGTTTPSTCIPIDNRLFALSESCLQVLNPPQPPNNDDPSRQCCARSWHKLVEPPFDSNFVSSYAVHPDG
jgi:hypothetical protein